MTSATWLLRTASRVWPIKFAQCTPQHACADHAKNHQHGPKCGHEAVPHGDHVDYLVGGHLHHPHGTHCDDHGALRVVS